MLGVYMKNIFLFVVFLFFANEYLYLFCFNFFVEQSEGMAQRILFLVGEIYSDVL